MALDFSLLGQGPQFGNILAAYQGGQQDRKTRTIQNALARYSDDPEGATAQVMAADPALGMKLRADMQARKAEAQRRAAFAETDPIKRQAAAVQTGDSETIRAAGEIQNQELSLAAKRADGIAGLAQSLKTLPYEQRKAQIAQMGPQLEAHGLTLAQLADYDPTDQNLDVSVHAAMTAKDQLAAADKDRDYGLQVRKQDFEESKPRLEKVGPGEKLFDVSGGAGAPTPAPTGTGPRSTRNNNPGNIEDGQFAKSQPGYKGTDGRFAVFDSPDAGKSAQVALLGSYAQRGINTVAGVINRWAPPSDNNPTPAYAKFVASKLGVAPDQPINMSDPKVLRGIADAIGQFEAGSQSASNGPAAKSGPRLVLDGGPKPGYRPATAEEKSAQGIPANVPAQVSPDGKIDVINLPGGQLKPVPPKVQSGYADNAKGMKQIDAAIASIGQNRGALGGSVLGYARNALGDSVSQRIDPGGVGTRADVANIGSLLIHDRSGAAVTAAETPRLLPFIPSVNDTPEAAIKKLKRLRAQYENANSEIEVQFGEDSGYRPMAGVRSAAPASPAAAKPTATGQRLSPEQAAKLPPGTKFIGMDGVPRTRH